MKKHLFTLSMILMNLTCFGPAAHAEIPTEAYPLDPSACTKQNVVSQSSDGVVKVVDGMLCHSLYGDSQLLEVVIHDLSYHKETYVYDRSRLNEYERSIKVYFVDDRFKFNFANGAAMYVGKTPEGHDRFIINLVSGSRPISSSAVSLYVKMNGNQYETTSVTVAP